MAEIIETRTGRTWLRDDGIVQSDGKPGAEHSVHDALENVAAIARLAHGRPRPSLVCLRHIKTISREARQYYAGPDAANALTAVALIVDSPVSLVIGSFFLGLNRASMPLRLFSSEGDAVAWLRTFVR